MINVALIGCGQIADLHYLGYKDNPDARVYAVCDPVPERAEARRKEWRAERAYTDCAELLRDARVDAVEVLTPYETHERIVVDALRAGKHVAVQKPMTTDLASADRMLAAARSAGTVFKVTECYVCYPPLVRAKELIDSGAIGDPMGIRIKYICSPHGGWQISTTTIAQQLEKANRGFGLETFDHGHHEWATAWYLMGSIEKVSAWIDSVDGVLDCPGTFMWKHREGKRYGICDFMYSAEMHMPTRYYSNDEWYEINGSRGVLLVNQGTGNMLTGPSVSLFDGFAWKHFDDIPADWSEGFIGATRNFIAAIQGKEQPLLTGEQGREILQFALAIAQSAKERREVYLDEHGKRFPRLYAWRRRRAESRDVIVGAPRREPKEPRGTAAYAPQAAALMEKLLERFDAEAARGWTCTVGVHLLAEGAAAEEKYAIRVADGSLDVSRGALPEDALLTLHLNAGLWAGILLGKKRLETAVLRGKIKYEGRPEEGLRLRKVFRI